MRSVFFIALSAIATLVAARENPFSIPGSGYEFTAGEPTTLTWEPTTDGPVTLKLQWGTAFTSSSGTTLASSIANSGSYTWDVPSDITDRSDYTIEIIDDEESEANNYLPRFSVEGATEAATTTTTSTSTTETTTTTTETSSTKTTTTETPTTLSTTTSTTSTSTESPSPTSSTSASGTPASTTTNDSESSTSSSATESPSESSSSVPDVNEDNAGMNNRVSGAMLVLALGVVAVI
ncbi:Ser-Thr-rich glycosyl-phosphatidyl-inositol-anchored membrane family-domain-containing protein [Aspergillus californicus]